MVQALDKENHTTILKDMIEQAELKDKHKHLLQLEKSTIEERIDTVVPQENEVFLISLKNLQQNINLCTDMVREKEI